MFDGLTKQLLQTGGSRALKQLTRGVVGGLGRQLVEGTLRRAVRICTHTQRVESRATDI